MVKVLAVFFQYFGFFAFIAMIVLTIMIKKELKKQLPTAEEKEELIKNGFINSDCKDKKILRSATTKLRYQKQLAKEIEIYINEQQK